MINRYKYFLIISLTTVMGQIYFQPFNSDFRFSLGVVTLALLILILKPPHILLVCIETGLFVILFRTFIDFAIYGDPLTQVFFKHLPSAGFYLIYGLLLSTLASFTLSKHAVVLLIFLAFADAFSNMVELLIRNNFAGEFSSMLQIIKVLLFIGSMRALFAVGGFLLIQYNNLTILKKEQYNHYQQLLLFTADLKTESLYLQKNMTDIEKAMTKSYALYTEVSNLIEPIQTPVLLAIQKKILSLTTDIHEIKKNDLRVLAGIQKLIPFSDLQNTLYLAEIIDLVLKNSQRVAETLEKNIQFFIDLKQNIKIGHYYHLFSILNNLLINSIDAVSEGQIYIKASISSTHLVIKVIDSGVGIHEDDLLVIFEPGFSTKFDPFSGKQSTGLGLTHVKLLVEELAGTISVKSYAQGGTTFTIKLPLNTISLEED